jgi:hypothetical protein
MTRNLRKDFKLLIEDLARDPEARYLEFLKDKPRTLVRDNLVFDVEALDSYFNCATCRRQNPRAYCCSGYDLELTDRDVKALAKVFPLLQRSFPELRSVVEDRRFWRWGKDYEKVMLRRKNDDCLFLRPGRRGCMIHEWALGNGIDPLAVKPYICSLYPVVVVIIDEQVVITTLNRESRAVLDTTDMAVACARKKGPPESHTLVRSREILTRMFGKKVYAELARKVFA